MSGLAQLCLAWPRGGRGVLSHRAWQARTSSKSPTRTSRPRSSASKLPVLVDFWAVWCAPCRAIAPHVEALAKEYDGKVRVGKCDIDSNPKSPTQYDIRSIPTLLVFKEGKVVGQVVGAVPAREDRRPDQEGALARDREARTPPVRTIRDRDRRPRPDLSATSLRGAVQRRVRPSMSVGQLEPRREPATG